MIERKADLFQLTNIAVIKIVMFKKYKSYRFGFHLID